MTNEDLLLYLKWRHVHLKLDYERERYKASLGDSVARGHSRSLRARLSEVGQLVERLKFPGSSLASIALYEQGKSQHLTLKKAFAVRAREMKK